MGLIGRQQSTGAFAKLDDISTLFDGSRKIFNLTLGGEAFYASNPFTLLVSVGGVIQEPNNAYTIIENQITFTTAPPNGTNNILVYSADKILIYLDEWYSLNPVITADQYLANDIAVSDQTVFTLPIHQRPDNFTLRLFNDSPFPVSLNSMMWEGIYSPRFYRRT